MNLDNLQPMVANHDNFSDRLNKACDAAGIVAGRGRVAELRRRCKDAGMEVSSEAVRKWLQENAIPRMSNAVVLARIIGADVNKLLTGESPTEASNAQKSLTAPSTTSDSDRLTPQERALLAMYRQLDATGKASVEEDIKKNKRLNDLEKENAELRKKAG